jgi:fatty-acyl-CoA synthase
VVAPFSSWGREHTVKAPYSRTLYELLDEQASRYPDHAAAMHEARVIGYSELAQRSRQVAAALRSLGVRRGERVAILMNNRIEWLEACFGASALGAVAVPFSTWSKPAELDFLLGDSKAVLLITMDRFGDRNYAEGLCGLIAELATLRPGETLHSARFPHLRGIVVLGETATAGMARYDELTQVGPLEQLPAPGAGACAVDDGIILYTSGSSSRPKAVRMSQYGIIENGFNIGERQGLTPADRVLVAVPLFWAYGAVNALPAALTHGATLVLQSKFDPGEALDLIETHRCTSIYTLPAMTSALLRHPAFGRARTLSLRTGLTIGSPQDVIRAAEALGAREICNVYGTSETYGNCCVTAHDWPLEERANSQGHPLPGVEIRVVAEETGTPVAQGEPGLIEVRGYLTPGYDGSSADQNAKAFTNDGFFRTGDMGRLTADRRFVFIGRTTEMIKRAGINVSPAEVEEILLQFPKIAQAGVTGVPDPEKGEVIVAFVVPVSNSTCTPAEVEAHCRTLASRYKVPDRIIVCSMLPVTVTGKLMRRALRDQAIAVVSKGS